MAPGWYSGAMAWAIEDLENHLLIGSTLVEGSTLTEGEARDVLAGRTIVGHPIREIRELTNYRLATLWLMDQLKGSPVLVLDQVLGFHARLMHGLAADAGRFKADVNYTMRTDGARHDYSHPSAVPGEMADWVVDFNAPSDDSLSGAARLYARFQAIHPFADGNGRIGRVLLAYYLHREGGRAFRFYASDKLAHLRAIEASDHGDLRPLREFIRARVTP